MKKEGKEGMREGEKEEVMEGERKRKKNTERRKEGRKGRRGKRRARRRDLVENSAVLIRCIIVPVDWKQAFLLSLLSLID